MVGQGRKGREGSLGALGDAAEKHSAVAHEHPSNIYVSVLTKHSCLLDSTVQIQIIQSQLYNYNAPCVARESEAQKTVTVYLPVFFWNDSKLCLSFLCGGPALPADMTLAW